MTVETLKPEEYPLLENVEEGFVPDSRFSRAIVCREDGSIIGRVFLVSPVHVEGLWIRKDKRNGTLLGRMKERVKEEAAKLCLRNILAFGMSGEMEAYLARMGFQRKPWSVWSLEV